MDSLRQNNKVYLGSPFRLYTRYRFRYRQNISFGFVAEKDEGEQFFKGRNEQGFDYYSAHLFIRGIGRLKALALGDYQAQFGQGLTFWSGLAFSSKSSFSMNVKRNATGLTPYASVNENLYLRGGAATFSLTKKLEVTGFVSSKRIDANVSTSSTNVDSLGNNLGNEVLVSSFQEDGFHRTNRELDNKDALGEKVIGGHLRYAASRIQRWCYGGTCGILRQHRTEYGHVSPIRFQRKGEHHSGPGLERAVPQPHLVR
ncbi:MAG: hypothetical protein IPO56_14685 [Flavobacteriales bacterium]|nr:hypothetical protein [Flavobacteriales bacterium]